MEHDDFTLDQFRDETQKKCILTGLFHRRTVSPAGFALVLVDYATRYPEAVALRNISAKSVADALFRIISRVSIPKEILTDQGTAFMSRMLREHYELLGIKSVCTSVSHPQTDGLVERFNRTLKTMIRKIVHEDAKNWLAKNHGLLQNSDSSVRTKKMLTEMGI